MAALARALLAVAVPVAAAVGWARLVGRPEHAVNWGILVAATAAALLWTTPTRDLRGLLHALWLGPVMTVLGAAIALLPTLDKPMGVGERLLVWACTYLLVVTLARVANRISGRARGGTGPDGAGERGKD